MTYNPEIIFGYDCFLTNRKYKYRHFKRGGTWRQLHERGKNSARVVRKPTILRQNGVDYNVITENGEVRFQRIGKPNRSKRSRSDRRPKASHPKDAILPSREKVLTPFGPVYTPPSQAVSVLCSTKLPKAGTFVALGDGHIHLSYLGGQTTLLPAKHHKKYWYFLRKKGEYRFSEHHPYGDEHRLILADKEKGVYPRYDQTIVGTKSRKQIRKDLKAT